MAMHVSSFTACFVTALFLLAAPVQADDKPPIPMPDDATDVTYDGAGGALDFFSAKSVKDLAAFYRDIAKQHGWKEQASVINNDNMQVLTFVVDGDNVATFTVMKMGTSSQVTAAGPALEANGGAGEPAAASDTQTVPAAAAPPLVAVDRGGLPIADGMGNNGSSSTSFSRSVNFSAPNSVADVVAFYRAELTKKGWKEDSAKVSESAAEISFTAPEGPAKLVVKRNGDMSDAELTLTEKSKAAASPLAPKAGMVKLVFGNMSDKAADVSIAGKHVKLAPGQGAKGPDGPTLEVKPGELTAQIKGAKPEAFTAGPDEIWMVMIGPGGVLAVQAY